MSMTNDNNDNDHNNNDHNNEPHTRERNYRPWPEPWQGMVVYVCVAYHLVYNEMGRTDRDYFKDGMAPRIIALKSNLDEANDWKEQTTKRLEGAWDEYRARIKNADYPEPMSTTDIDIRNFVRMKYEFMKYNLMFEDASYDFLEYKVE